MSSFGLLIVNRNKETLSLLPVYMTFSETLNINLILIVYDEMRTYQSLWSENAYSSGDL